MPSKKAHKKTRSYLPGPSVATATDLKVGDTVMIIAGGHSTKRPNIGKTGVIKAFAGDKRDRVILEGMNLITKHKRQTSMQDQAAKVMIESPIHISNVMYYVEKIKAPVRLRSQVLEDGKKVRGYMDKQSGEFIQV